MLGYAVSFGPFPCMATLLCVVSLSLNVFAIYRRAEYAQSTSKRVLSELQAGNLDL